MDLGTYTFAALPQGMTMLQAEKPSAFLETYSDVAFFSWDPTIVGKIIILNWNAMTTAQFDSIDTLFQADAEVVFDPTDYTGSDTYNVEIVGFRGEYWPGISGYRLNCELELLIMSVVT